MHDLLLVLLQTAQMYAEKYKDDEEKHLPIRKQKVKWQRKLEPQHTDFLCDFFSKTPEAVLWQARDMLIGIFPDINPVT